MRADAAPGTDPSSIEVVLEDDLHPEDEPRPPWRGRRRVVRLGWAAALLVVAVVAAVVVADVRRSDGERAAALSDVPGRVASLDVPLEQVWAWRDGPVELVTRTDDVVVVRPLARAATLLGLDAATGEVRWERTGARDEWCRPLEAGDPWSPGTVAALVCWTASDVAQSEGPVAVEPSELVTVDAWSGEIDGSVGIDGAVLGVEPLDRAALVAYADAAGSVVLARWDPVLGLTWRVRGEPDALARIQDEGMVLTVQGDVVWFGGIDAVGRSVVTGEVVPGSGTVPPVMGAGVVPLDDGGRIEWGLRGATPVDGTWTRVVDAGGAQRFEVDGRPWVAPVTDGSGGVLVVQAERGALGGSGPLVGYDVRTGERVWELEGLRGLEPAVQLSGIVTALGSGRTVAVEVATGEVRWEGRGTVPGTSVTDGSRWLVTTTVGDGPALTAVDVRTGAAAWDVVLETRPTAVLPVGDRVLVLDDRGCAMYATPGD